MPLNILTEDRSLHVFCSIPHYRWWYYEIFTTEDIAVFTVMHFLPPIATILSGYGFYEFVLVAMGKTSYELEKKLKIKVL